mgnify:CR=1 FL=1
MFLRRKVLLATGGVLAVLLLLLCAAVSAVFCADVSWHMNALLISILIMGALGVAGIVATLFVIDRLIHQRLREFAAQVREYGERNDPNLRLPETGSGELTELARAVNGAFERLNVTTRALQDSEQRYRAMVEDQAEFLVRTLNEGTITTANEAFCRHLGQSKDRVIGRNFLEFVPEGDQAVARRARSGLSAQSPVAVVEHRGRRTDGAVCWLHWTLHAIFDENGTILEVQCIGRDVTEAHEVQERLHLQSSALSASAHAIVIADSEGTIRWANPAFTRLTGYPLDEALGRNLSLLRSGKHPPEFYAHMQEVILQGKTWRGELINRRKDGTLYHEAQTITPVRDSEGRCAHFIAIKEDISDRVRSREALQESEEKYRHLFENNPQPMYVYDPGNLRFLAVNRSAVEHYGWSRDEFLAMTIKDIRPESDVPMLLEEMARTPEGDRRARLWRHHRKDGTQIDVELTEHPIPFGGQRAKLVLVNDVTERRGLEDRLRQAQKMEAIGRMAGGVAHDFNNLLMVISGYGELLANSLESDDPRRENADQILRAATRAGNLTRQLLAFSRRQVAKPRVLLLNRTINGMEPLLRRLIGEDISLVIGLDHELGHLRADPSQIEQVVMNLAANARDAMPQGGRLSIRTENVDLTADRARRCGLTAGYYVCLVVSDTGTGMDAQTRAHLFEPFYTTKAKGKGTGLGLSVVYGIVEQSGGAICVESEKGKGTTFTIYFPRVEAPVEETMSVPLPGNSERGQGTVLVVEDEVGVRELVASLLRARGYQVMEANNGREALEVAGAHAGTIDLLLTDVVMPEMNGNDLSEKLLTLRPDTKVIYMSGYAPQTLFQRNGLNPEAIFLQKPFLPQVLIQKVQDVLKTASA